MAGVLYTDWLVSNVDSVSFQIKSITDTAGNTEDTLTSFNVDDSQKTVRIDVEKPAVKPGSIRFSTFDTCLLYTSDAADE